MNPRNYKRNKVKKQCVGHMFVIQHNWFPYKMRNSSVFIFADCLVTVVYVHSGVHDSETFNSARYFCHQVCFEFVVTEGMQTKKN